LDLEPKGILKVNPVNENPGLIVLLQVDIERWIAL